ncbi:MAG: hypothetical protein PSW75_11910 [bacterium]|nr:hypothetical protein [bacterium]
MTRLPHFLSTRLAPKAPPARCSARGVLFVLGFALAAADSGAAFLREKDGFGTNSIPERKLGDDELVIDEVFQSHLPGTLEKYGLRLSVHPHLGDWRDKDHMRMTTTLRYGLTENCELSAGSNLFFSHGHGDIKAFGDDGAADFKFGVKLNLGQTLFSGWETGVGATYERPIGHPAPELTDGLRHFRPYVTFSHRLEGHPGWRIFVGLRFDNVTKTSLPGSFAKNSFQDNSAGITGGFVIDRDNLHYTFEASCDTTRLAGTGRDEIYSIRPGILWEIPQRRNHQLKSNSASP